MYLVSKVIHHKNRYHKQWSRYYYTGWESKLIYQSCLARGEVPIITLCCVLVPLIVVKVKNCL